MSAKTVTLTSYIPSGLPTNEHFTIIESPLPTENDMTEGSILLQVLSMSADPYLRSGCKSEANGGAIPRPMAGFVAGKVLASKRPDFVAGDFFGASLPFTTVQIIPAEKAKTTLIWKLTGMVTEETISHGIGVLGMPGSTAYGGLLDVLRPKPSSEQKEGEKQETLWVSGSAGCVGSLVSQIGKNVCNLKVIGSCGGPEKVSLCVDTFGVDAAVDYKQCPDRASLDSALKIHAPEGIDMYFDNVGGMHFEVAMENLRPYGRAAICGGISHYNEGERSAERIFPTDMIYGFKRIEGFMCRPWLAGKKGNFLKDMSQWLGEGKVKVEETFFDGIESWPMAFQSLFTGKKRGKVVVKITAASE